MQNHHDTAQHKQDKTAEQKKVTWDELVHVRRFAAHSEELKKTYPKPYPYKHGSSRWSQGVHHHGLSQGPKAHYQTSAIFDLF